ncbi:Coagulation factor VIII [Anabarilius grahami]|uniref:Coagulation factor VIII n=1 Tax=Anabarilius grahami TaxID=495550 RepID=A0A3N0Y4H6_ANAGA|nr:Coagulation factor VIII [Anabarilius grahami]
MIRWPDGPTSSNVDSTFRIGRKKADEDQLQPTVWNTLRKLSRPTKKNCPTADRRLGCSMPLGMERRSIPSSSISASSFLNKWLLSWSPDLARLHQEGRANAWRPKTNNPHEWLQVDFLSMKRVTGLVTQGARAVLKLMMVTEFTVSISNNGHSWTSVKEQGTDSEKIFEGNSEHDEEALNMFDPPLFARFIRIHPKGWVNDIALRLEFLGCDTQPTL